MATQEVNKPQSLPPYPEMIMKALEALHEPNGSNKSSITNYIESTYGELPEGHSNLVSHHLNQLKESGELVFSKNNYMKPDPNAPPKRGRGRPPKPKDPLAPLATTVLSPPRPRGRPPKDPNASPKPKVSSGSGRPRGRPKKIARTEDSVSVSASASASGASSVADVGVSGGTSVAAVPVAPSGKPRGRPPKVKPQMTEVSVES
ncbi:HMG-Y-related protein A-like [Cicer arietinum]|uniref:HMG-Y-related protein A-like n=1 Tax=Cicer arietinum TaxID=3827 RepID=A0A1S2XM84_CICAR|nr:HMG-Y-related protein A-like [Cicer arietinum]